MPIILLSNMRLFSDFVARAARSIVPIVAKVRRLIPSFTAKIPMTFRRTRHLFCFLAPLAIEAGGKANDERKLTFVSVIDVGMASSPCNYAIINTP